MIPKSEHCLRGKGEEERTLVLAMIITSSFLNLLTRMVYSEFLNLVRLLRVRSQVVSLTWQDDCLVQMKRSKNLLQSFMLTGTKAPV